MPETKPYGSSIDQWNETREITFQIVQSMPDDIDINWKPHPEMNELGKLLRHTVGSVYFMFNKYLKRKMDTPSEYSEIKIFTKELFARDLEATDKMVKDLINELTEEDLKKEAYIWRDRQYLVEWVVWNLKGHERWHQAQIKMYMKLMGLDTSKIGH
jgi:uncharacterized damage-inducible protein DinB